MVLSKMKATDPPTNIAVVRSTFSTWSISTMPEKDRSRECSTICFWSYSTDTKLNGSNLWTGEVTELLIDKQLLPDPQHSPTVTGAPCKSENEWLKVWFPFRALTGDQWVLFEVVRQHQAKEDREAQDKEVPGGVEVDKLQVGQSHCCNHTKQGAEQRSQDWVRQRGKEGTEFTHEPQQQHHGSSILDYTPAAHLENQLRLLKHLFK